MKSVLSDVLASGLDIIFCGTAVGKASAQRGAYYAGPGNRFWQTLHRVGLTPHQFTPEEYKNLRRLRIGLTDLVKIISGSDRILSKRHFDVARLKALILKYRPRILAFTSKRAAQSYLGRKVDYGLMPEKEGNTILFVLPSPSGAGRRYWNEAPWRELSRLRAALSNNDTKPTFVNG